ncbi:MAG: Grx4 family monothiol glutaredoxin [Candidatus Omnitrophica bacterium]|nr:Grx4 family monothiol glutaredoxin [Candidatus Omnitrophota bacterium]
MSDVLERIKTEIESHKIVLFMKGEADAPMCGFSAATVQVLKSLDAPFRAVNVLTNPDVRQALPGYSQWPTFPQLFVNGQLIGGCDIVHELRDSGELKKIIDSALGR